MTDLPVPASAASAVRATRLRRQTFREIEHIRAEVAVDRATDHAHAELARQRVQDLQALTQQSLLAATEIAAVEHFCADRAPHAIRRLSCLADIGTAGIAQTLNHFAQR